MDIWVVSYLLALSDYLFNPIVLDYEKKVDALIKSELEDSEKENCSPFEGASQIQMVENIDELKLKGASDQLQKVENIQRDVEDLHEMYQNLNEMVGSQAENVDHIEKVVDNTQQNVESGTKELEKAHK